MILGFDLAMLEWFAGRWPLALEHAVAANELAAQIQDLARTLHSWAGTRR